MPKVLVGMSGGVDSAAAAYLLKEAGYEVIGATLRTWIPCGGEEGSCREIDDAAAVAKKLGIPHYPLDATSEFKEKVVRPFVSDYIKGLTPSPCIECNRYVKWERMLHFAEVFEADYIATGHYAYVVKLDNGRYTVKKASHIQKDQTYMLYKLTQEQLASTLMPLGKYTKDEVRRIAEEAGLPVADKPDSQEICFVTEGDYTDFIEKYAESPVSGEGFFVDEEGKILGKHKGIIHYTPGQRRGLGLPLGYPAYVKKLCPSTNEVVIGKESSLYSQSVICRDVNFLSIPEPENGEIFRCEAKIRYHHVPQSAAVQMLGEGRVKIQFEKPVRAAAPGQSAVFYDGDDCLIGGGIIEEAE